MSTVPAHLRNLLAAAWSLLPRDLRVSRWRWVDPLNRAALAAGADPLVVVRMRQGHLLRLDLRSGTEWFAYYSREFDDRRIAAARRLLRTPGAVAVDAGANVGLWAVPLAHHLAALGGHLLALEPMPANARRLRENLALNGLAEVADVREVAVSDRAGTATLSLREDFRAGAGTGNASLVIDDGTDEQYRRLEVETFPLDALLADATRVDFVKADLEGHEDRFLIGAVETFRRCRPVAVLEWNRVYYDRRGVDPTAATAGVLRDLDYRCLRYTAAGWSAGDEFASPRPVDDLVLTPRERVAEVLAAVDSW
ncbi:MAG TPA: FkbM family methyltransferase [Mycobacteriales bacterium]